MTVRMFAEYREASALLRAIGELRRKGYEALEAYTPYPLHGVDEALGTRPSRLPWAVFGIGVCAASAAYALQWFLNAYLYPLNVGSRPPHYPLSYVPITFEMGILFASFSAFFGVLVLGRLLRPYDPVFETPGFESASNDAFWIRISDADPKFERAATERDLRDSGAHQVVTTEVTP
jgi:hypothetical protein